jgi:hypothetical protein
LVWRRASFKYSWKSSEARGADACKCAHEL